MVISLEENHITQHIRKTVESFLEYHGSVAWLKEKEGTGTKKLVGRKIASLLFLCRKQ